MRSILSAEIKKPGTVTGFFVALTVSLLAYKKAWQVAQ